MNEMNNHPFPDDKKNKVDYMWRDIERRAEEYGFYAKTPVPYPLTEFDLANKLAIVGLKEGWGIEYIKLTYKRWFQEEKEPATEPNISDEDAWKILHLFTSPNCFTASRTFKRPIVFNSYVILVWVPTLR